MGTCATPLRPAHPRGLLTRFSGHAQPSALASLPMGGAIHPHIYTSLYPYIHTPIHPYTHTPIHPYTHTPIHPYTYIFTPTPLLPIPGCLYHNIGCVYIFPQYFCWLGGNELGIRHMTEEPVTPPYPPLGVVVYTARFL